MTSIEVTITASEYFLVRSFRRISNQRDYTATVLGAEFKNRNLAELKTVIRQHCYRETGSDRVRFMVVEPASNSKIPVN
jgi:hypothetical protein